MLSQPLPVPHTGISQGDELSSGFQRAPLVNKRIPANVKVRCHQAQNWAKSVASQCAGPRHRLDARGCDTLSQIAAPRRGAAEALKTTTGVAANGAVAMGVLLRNVAEAARQGKVRAPHQASDPPTCQPEKRAPHFAHV